MKINKYQKNVNSGIIDLELIDGEKVLDVMYLNNFDVYWSFVALNADNMEFEIPKEHYSLYQLFKTYSMTNQMSVEERISLITFNSKTHSIDFMCKLFNVTR